MTHRKEIAGFPGYYICDDGTVWSANRRGAKGLEQMAAQKHSKYGHLHVMLRRDKKSHGRHVHRLVLEAFVGPCPEGMEACHFPDRDPTNNRLENLRWGSHQSNQQDMRAHGTSRRGTKNPNAKLNDTDIPVILDLIQKGVLRAEIAERYGVKRNAIYLIKSGKLWKHIKRS